MLSDLDSLMRSRELDAIVVPMHEAMHPSFRWLTRGAKVTRGYAIKRIDRDPVLITYPMERDEAAATGLEVRIESSTTEDYGEFYDSALRGLGIAGTIAFFGNAPLHLYHGVFEALASRGWKLHRANGEDLIQLARKRKDAHEIAAIRSVGERTELVVDRVREVLREVAIRGDAVTYRGESLTIGMLKQLVSSEVARLGMIEDHETILSQGADAAVPHSRGDARAPVRPSSPIVLDIFPADKTSGYFFDMTRTFCIGPIPDALREMHAQVFTAFTRARDAMRPGTPASSYQALVCDYFESLGHATTRSNPATTTGYVHGLGHGVGLDIHEKPSFQLTPSNRDLVEEGDIVTIEPGLYDPARGLGVRIEDTFVVVHDRVETMCRGGYELEP